MGYNLDQLLLFKSVFYGLPKMKSQLIRAIQGNQCCHGYQAAITLGKLLSFPDIAEEHSVSEFNELGCEVANHLLCCRGLLAHDSFLLIQLLLSPISFVADCFHPLHALAVESG